MKTTLIILICLLFSGCATFKADPWTKDQVILQGTSMVLRGMDWGTTLDMVGRPGYKEINPILGEHPDRGEINTYFAASMLGNFLMTHFLPSEHRKYWLGLNIAASIICVGNNYHIGLRMNF